MSEKTNEPGMTEVEALKAALQPFVEMAETLDRNPPFFTGDSAMSIYTDNGRVYLDIAHLRAARDVLKGKQP